MSQARTLRGLRDSNGVEILSYLLYFPISGMQGVASSNLLAPINTYTRLGFALCPPCVRFKKSTSNKGVFDLADYTFPILRNASTAETWLVLTQ